MKKRNSSDGVDASSSRRVEYAEGRILAVCKQGARKRNEEMRSISRYSSRKNSADTSSSRRVEHGAGSVHRRT